MDSFKLYGKMLGFLKPYLFALFLTILLSFVVVLLDSVSIWFVTTLPKVLFEPQTAPVQPPQFSFHDLNTYLKDWTHIVIFQYAFLNPVITICLLIIVSFTLKNIASYANTLLAMHINYNVSRNMRNALYGHVLLLPKSFFDRNKTGNIISLLINDLNQINLSLGGTIKTLCTEPLRLIFFISLLLIINWKMSLMVFTVYPVMGYMIYKIGLSVKRRITRELESFSGMIGIITETITGIRAVKMFNMDEAENLKFGDENERFRRRAFKSNATREILSPLTETMAILLVTLLLWYGGKSVIDQTGSFSADDFLRFLFLLLFLYQPLKNLGNVNTMIQSGLAAAKRVFAIIEIPCEPLVKGGGKRIPAFNSEISVTGVSFAYPQTETKVLTGISFSVRKGQVVAIVGSSGAGKSTILDLLPRFYDIQEGTIAIDGTDIRTFDLAGLRELFGIVSQETVMFNDTIRANISYGSRTVSDSDIIAAADAANAMEFINNMPQGLDTVIGERGVTLSGGQRQRLSIARALLRNPQILILDEATSALDTESELLVQNAIDRLLRNRTSLVVAHRLSTIRHADTILVLEGGRIIESGTHQELLELGKRYKHFYDIQFSMGTADNR